MSCESSSQLNLIDKDPLSQQKTDYIQDSNEPKCLVIESLCNQLQCIVAHGNDNEFEAALSRIGQQIQRDKNSILLTNHVLHSRILKLFYKAYKDLQYSEGQQQYLLFLLSLLGQILRNNSELKLPFSKKTAFSILAFDHQSLDKVNHRSQIIKIMTILYANMAKQARLMVRIGVEDRLKKGLLSLISKADEFSVLRILLRAMLELQAKSSITITPKQLQDSTITSKFRDIFGDKAVCKIKQILCRPKIKNIVAVTSLTLCQLISHK